MQRQSFPGASFVYGIGKALGSPMGAHRGFEEIARKSGVAFHHNASRTPQKYLPEVMGAGTAMFGGGTGHHWLMVETVGVRSNRDGIGSRIRIVTESGAEQFGYVSTAGSYASASDKRVHFGLGQESKVQLLEIQWPSGAV